MVAKRFFSKWTQVLFIFLFSLSGFAYGQKKLDLHEAIIKGEIELAKKLISENAGINEKDKSKVTPLMLAAEKDQMEIARLLVDSGADIRIKDTSKWTALMYALRYGHLEIVELLIENGADIYDKDENGWTTLMIAAGGGNLDVVKMVIEKGVDINKSADFDTAVCVAFKKDHDNIGEFLLERGAKHEVCSALNSPEGLAYYANGKMYMYLAKKFEESGEAEEAIKNYLEASKFFEKAAPKLMEISEKFGKGKKIKSILFYGTSLADLIVSKIEEPFEAQRIEYADKSKRCSDYSIQCKENIERIK